MTDPRLPGARPGSQARRPPAQTPPTRFQRPDLDARTGRGKPDATAVRMILGLAGLASASALATAMLPSILPRQTVMVNGADVAATDPTQQPEPSVIHVTHVVTLAPGQTLPPDAQLGNSSLGSAPTPTPKATPRPTPRVVYQTITRQSGRP